MRHNTVIHLSRLLDFHSASREAVVIILAGGSKSTQQADIRQAKDLARIL